MQHIIKNDLNNLEDILKTNFKAKYSKQVVKHFESKFANKFNSKYGIACCNGTATLHGILMGMGIDKYDEVITTPLTMSATALSILHSNALPVFADVDPNTFQIDPKSIEDKITDKTKAIMTVSLYGLSPEMDEIMKIANKYNLYVIEDNAQCFLGEYKNQLVGTFGDASSFSFQNTKHMTTGEGGMIITNNINLQDKIAKSTILGYQTVGELAPKFEIKDFRNPNFDRHISYGFNYRMSELCAAVGINRLDYLDYFVDNRIKVAQMFEKVINDTKCNWLVPQKVESYIKHVYWGYTVKITNNISFNDFRDKLISFGGKPPYAAWKLTYLEPYFYNKTFSDNQIQQFKEGLCPNAESIQSKIISFQNNYIVDESLEEIEIQLKALRNTILHFNKRIVGVIYCRLGSTRLPNKALLKLNNIESIKRTINQTYKMNLDVIVLATGNKENNSELEQFNIPVIYGSEDNLFERTNLVINKLNLTNNDYIIRLTGDDVCRSYEIANELIEITKFNDYDYITNHPSDCPIGLGSEILSVKSIKFFNNLIKEPNEHLTCYYLFFKNIMNIKIITLDEQYKLNTVITLDDNSDFELLNNFFTDNNINNDSVPFNLIKTYFSKTELIKEKVCLGNSPDTTLELLNDICSKYPNYSPCYNIKNELINIYLKNNYK